MGDCIVANIDARVLSAEVIMQYASKHGRCGVLTVGEDGEPVGGALAEDDGQDDVLVAGHQRDDGDDV